MPERLVMIGGEIVDMGRYTTPREEPCCDRCGAAPHRERPCRGYGSAGEANEGHRGDEQ